MITTATMHDPRLLSVMTIRVIPAIISPSKLLFPFENLFFFFLFFTEIILRNLRKNTLCTTALERPDS